MGKIYIKPPCIEKGFILKEFICLSSYWDSDMSYTLKIIIKECVKRSWFFTHNYGDLITWSFDTYGTQRWAIVVCSHIDFIYALVKENRIKENLKHST